MNRASTAPAFDFNRFFTSLDQKLEPPVREHLKSVYSCLALSTFAAALGGYIHATAAFMTSGLLTLLLAFGSLIALATIQDDGKNRLLRVGLLSSFALFSGINLGPLLELAVHINPTIISKAFLSTAVIFACFTLSALYAPSRQFLYLGGILMSALSTLFTLSLANLFFGSLLVFQINLYLGLVVMCGFILYDTHLIIEKRKAGDKDFIWHSVDLFIDFIGIFRRLLIILMMKEEKKPRRD